MLKRRGIIEYIWFMILFCLFLYLWTYIHEIGHYLAAKAFWLDSTITILENPFKLSDLLTFDNDSKVRGYTSFDTLELKKLSIIKQIIIYVAWVWMEIITLWLIFYFYNKIIKNKDVKSYIIYFFIMYTLIVLYYNIYPNNSNNIPNDWYNIELLYKK